MDKCKYTGLPIDYTPCKTCDDAGRAYNEGAIKYHGEYAKLNKIGDGNEETKSKL